MIVKSILFISFPQVLYGTVHHSFHFTRHFFKKHVQTTPAVNSSTDCRADCREERRDSAEVRWSSSSEAWRARLTSWLSVQAAGRRLDVNSVGNGRIMLINAVYTPLTPIHLVSPIHILYTKPWSLQRGNWLPLFALPFTAPSHVFIRFVYASLRLRRRGSFLWLHWLHHFLQDWGSIWGCLRSISL
jgi:hypothetical protein